MFGVYIGYEGHDLVYCLCRVGNDKVSVYQVLYLS